MKTNWLICPLYPQERTFAVHKRMSALPPKVAISENSQTLSARRKPAVLHGAIPAVWLIFANVIAIDAELSRWMVSAPARQIGSTRHGIGDVVVATGAMVNRVLATSRNASFEAAELVRQPFAFRQH